MTNPGFTATNVIPSFVYLAANLAMTMFKAALETLYATLVAITSPVCLTSCTELSPVVNANTFGVTSGFFAFAFFSNFIKALIECVVPITFVLNFL